MADNDRLDRIAERIEANTDLIARIAERQASLFWTLHSRQMHIQRQLNQFSQDVELLLAAVQGHVDQPHPPAHRPPLPLPQ